VIPGFLAGLVIGIMLGALLIDWVENG